MIGIPDLEYHLSVWAADDPARRDLATAIVRLAEAGRAMSELVGQGALAGLLGASTGRCGVLEQQRSLDLVANRLFLDAARRAPVAGFLSEELALPVEISAGASLLIAVDPLDGASDLDAGISVGTTFSIMPAPRTASSRDDLAQAFMQPGSHQLAAGAMIYGAFTALAMTVGEGTHLFTLDRRSGRFVLTAPNVCIPAEATEFAIDAATARHWPPATRTYIDDCQRGRDGPRSKDFSMRWTGSMVAELFRVLTRGGIVLCPGDNRVNQQCGVLRLLYQANPLAFLIEQAGGVAVSGATPCRDVVPVDTHQCAPFAAGSRDEVARVVRLHLNPDATGERSQLFGHRGLFWT